MHSGNLEDSRGTLPLLGQLDPTNQTLLVGLSSCTLGEERGLDAKPAGKREKHSIFPAPCWLAGSPHTHPKALKGGPWKPLMNDNLSAMLLVSDALYGFENHIP